MSLVKTAEIKAVEKALANKKGSRLCTTCGHIGVCSIFRAIAPLMTSFSKDEKTEPPFRAENLAVICSEYFPQTLIDLVKPES